MVGATIDNVTLDTVLRRQGVGFATSSLISCLVSLDITKNQNNVTYLSVTNQNAGSSASAGFFLNSDVNSLQFGAASSTYSTAIFAGNVGLVGTANDFIFASNTLAGVGGGAFKWFSSGQLIGNLKMTLTNAGKLGIGVAAPDYALHVVSDTGIIAERSNGRPTIAIYNNNNAVNATNGTIAGDLDFAIYQNSTKYLEVAKIQGVYTGNGTTRTGDLVFLTGNSGYPAEKMRITAAGDLVLTGRIASGNNAVIGSSSNENRLWDFAQTVSTFSTDDWYMLRSRVVLNPGASVAGLVAGITSELKVGVANANTFDTIYSANNRLWHAGTGTVTQATGANNLVFSSSSGNITNAAGSSNAVFASTGSTATIASAIGGAFQIGASAVGSTITNGYGIYIYSPIATGTLTNSYGLFIADQDVAGGTIRRAIKTGTGLVDLGADLKVLARGAFGSTASIGYDGTFNKRFDFRETITDLTASLNQDGVIQGFTLNPSANFAGGFTGTYSFVTLANGNTRNVNSINGTGGLIDLHGSGTIGQSIAIYGYSESFGSNAVTVQIGVNGAADVQGTSTVATNIAVAGLSGAAAAGGTATIDATFYAYSPFHTGTMGTHYGLYMEDQAYGTTNYAIYTNSGKVRFGGQVLITDGTAANPALTFSSSTNQGVYLTGGNVGISSGGIMAAVFGVSGGTSYWKFNTALGIQDQNGNGVFQAQSGSGGVYEFYNAQTFLVTQAAFGSGAPTAFRVQGGAHTNVSGDIIDVEFNFTRTITWATGLTDVYYIGQRNFPATIASAGTTAFGGISAAQFDFPLIGSGTITSDIHLNTFFKGGEGIGTDASVVALFEPMSLKNGVGDVGLISNVYLGGSTFFGTQSLGNQTATLTDLGSLIIDAVTYDSTTLTRTVTNPGTVIIKGAPSAASGRVIFTNPTQALWVQAGNSRFGGNVSIGGALSGTVAALEIISTTQGILLPRMTTTQRNAITPVEGLIVYDVTLHGTFQYDGTTWVQY